MTDIQEIDLETLVGPHLLDGVDFDTKQVRMWHDRFEDCQVMRFRLDGVIYVVVENPDDGYRSSMKHAYIGTGEMKNTFPPVPVVGRWRTKGEYSGADEVLELLAMKTGALVLEAGTLNCDDYYPGFVATFSPEAITEAS